MAETYPRLQRGRMAWLLMQEISQGNREPHVLQAFRELEGDLGSRHVALPLCAGYESCHSRTVPGGDAWRDTSGCAGILEFRIMVGCGSLLLLVMLIALVQTLRGKMDQHRWVLKMAL
ncbi:hypothetical protein ACULNC_24450 [Shigella flexneri]